MKKTFLRFLALPVFAASSAVGATITENFNFNALNLAVPDGNPSGLANNQVISSTIVDIDSITVSVNLAGTFNGDLYAYLQHSTGISILLNRSGKTASSPFGYGDDGFNVTFDDAVVNDVHVYQLSLIPTPGNPLTGTWQPDARFVDPNLVLDTSPRSAFLSAFDDMNASGSWTLFVSDVTSGDTHTLSSWGMSITGDNIPEPSTPILFGLAVLGAWVRRRR